MDLYTFIICCRRCFDFEANQSNDLLLKHRVQRNMSIQVKDWHREMSDATTFQGWIPSTMYDESAIYSLIVINPQWSSLWTTYWGTVHWQQTQERKQCWSLTPIFSSKDVVSTLTHKNAFIEMALQRVSILSIDHLTLYCKAHPRKLSSSLIIYLLVLLRLDSLPKSLIQIHSLVFSTILPHIPQVT